MENITFKLYDFFMDNIEYSYEHSCLFYDILSPEIENYYDKYFFILLNETFYEKHHEYEIKSRYEQIVDDETQQNTEDTVKENYIYFIFNCFLQKRKAYAKYFCCDKNNLLTSEQRILLSSLFHDKNLFLSALKINAKAFRYVSLNSYYLKEMFLDNE